MTAEPAKDPAEDSSLADEALRAHLVEYQRGSLREIYARLSHDLRRYFRYLTRRADGADDLVQETFLQMHRSRATYNPAFAARPWIFGLARHVYLMDRRATSRRHAVLDPGDVPEVPIPPDVEGLADRNAVQRALAELSADQAEALLLHHVWGFTFDEVAGMLGISSASARARASRGMRTLRHLLGSR